MGPRFDLFLIAIGLKPGFRRTGPSRLVNIAFVSLVGVISGHYIWKEPLEQYWREKRLQEQQALAAEGGGGGEARKEGETPLSSAKATSTAPSPSK